MARRYGLRDITIRSTRLAHKCGSTWCGAEHIFLSLVEGDDGGPARVALTSAGIDASIVDYLATEEGGANPGASPNPRHHEIVSITTGLALAAGTKEADEHALLALIYSGFLVDLVGEEKTGLLLASLRESGLTVPAVAPPAESRRPDLVTRIYYPTSDGTAVVAAMIKRFPPPDSLIWGVNKSQWKEGFDWLDADQACDAAQIVVSVCEDRRQTLEVPIREAVEEESAARYRKRGGASELR